MALASRQTTETGARHKIEAAAAGAAMEHGELSFLLKLDPLRNLGIEIYREVDVCYGGSMDEENEDNVSRAGPGGQVERAGSLFVRAVA